MCVEKGWLVHYECFDGDDPRGPYDRDSWGRTGARNRIQFQKYDPAEFQRSAPGGWEITRIDRVGNHNEDED